MERIYCCSEIERRNLFYHNDCYRLASCDFINSIKDDIIKRLSKDRECLTEIHFLFEYRDRNVREYYPYGNQTPLTIENFDFGVNGINANDLIKKFLKDKLSINDFDNKYFILRISFSREYDDNKLSHKKKFFKSLDKELIKTAMHPSRYFDWCIDINKQKLLEELWGDED